MRLAPRGLLIVFLVVVAFLAGGAWGHAQRVTQVPAPRTPGNVVVQQESEPVVLSGADIGFRMHGKQRGTPVGVLVVRVDGQWREVQFAMAVKPVTR